MPLRSYEGKIHDYYTDKDRTPFIVFHQCIFVLQFFGLKSQLLHFSVCYGTTLSHLRLSSFPSLFLKLSPLFKVRLQ